ncbi:FHA domain-containing protein [Streptomyces pathocidini]|uniref:FHA domain-containing protein n=1 Tax=Streptomyces pathocidini TaxID=1650571 RepID=UPI0033ED5B4E
MPTCPNGHTSVSDSWCEVCGQRMAGPGAPAGGYGYPNQPPGLYDANANAHAELCPQCRKPREGLAPFCDQCRYNFLTHSPTAYAPPPQTPQAPQQTGGGQGGLPPGFQQVPPPPPQQHQAPPPPQAPQGFGFQNPPGFPDQQRPQPPAPGFAPPPRPDAPTPVPPQGFAPPPAPAPPAPAPAPQAPQPVRDFGPPPGAPAPPAGQDFRGSDDWTLPPPQAPQPPQGPPSHAPQAPYGAQPPRPGADWVAVVAPDHEYFRAMMGRSGPEAAGLNLPYVPEQRHPLSGRQVTIGRRRPSTGESPDIDLGGRPEDPGVSHQHATLVAQPDGSWAVIDQNSTNGTTINGGDDPIRPFVPHPLQEGDRVHVGAWTTITVRRG